MKRLQLAGYQAKHFGYTVDGKVATITLNRPDRKNPLTFDSYAELRELFRNLVYADDVKAVVLSGEGGNFCSNPACHGRAWPEVNLNVEAKSVGAAPAVPPAPAAKAATRGASAPPASSVSTLSNAGARRRRSGRSGS